MADSGGRRIPLRLSDFSVIDSEFSNIRERFDAEMSKMEEEMTKFRSELMNRESSLSQRTATSSRMESSKSEFHSSSSSSATSSSSQPLITGAQSSRTEDKPFENWSSRRPRGSSRSESLSSPSSSRHKSSRDSGYFTLDGSSVASSRRHDDTASESDYARRESLLDQVSRTTDGFSSIRNTPTRQNSLDTEADSIIFDHVTSRHSSAVPRSVSGSRFSRQNSSATDYDDNVSECSLCSRIDDDGMAQCSMCHRNGDMSTSSSRYSSRHSNTNSSEQRNYNSSKEKIPDSPDSRAELSDGNEENGRPTSAQSNNSTATVTENINLKHPSPENPSDTKPPIKHAKKGSKQNKESNERLEWERRSSTQSEDSDAHKTSKTYGETKESIRWERTKNRWNDGQRDYSPRRTSDEYPSRYSGNRKYQRSKTTRDGFFQDDDFLSDIPYRRNRLFEGSTRDSKDSDDLWASNRFKEKIHRITNMMDDMDVDVDDIISRSRKRTSSWSRNRDARTDHYGENIATKERRRRDWSLDRRRRMEKESECTCDVLRSLPKYLDIGSLPRWSQDMIHEAPKKCRHCRITSSSTSSSMADAGGPRTWLDDLNSPLIQEDGNEKRLKLRFDVAQYQPEEIVVKTLDNKLMVHAKHDEKTENRSVYREYNREFLLPKGTNPEAIKSSLSKDGVLTVEAPLPGLMAGEKCIPIDHK